MLTELNGEEMFQNLKKYFKFCEKLVAKINVNLIFDSLVIKKYCKIRHRVDGNLLYYPSDFTNKKKLVIRLRKIKLKNNYCYAFFTRK